MASEFTFWRLKIREIVDAPRQHCLRKFQKSSLFCTAVSEKAFLIAPTSSAARESLQLCVNALILLNMIFALISREGFCLKRRHDRLDCGIGYYAVLAQSSHIATAEPGSFRHIAGIIKALLSASFRLRLRRLSAPLNAVSMPEGASACSDMSLMLLCFGLSMDIVHLFPTFVY